MKKVQKIGALLQKNGPALDLRDAWTFNEILIFQISRHSFPTMWNLITERLKMLANLIREYTKIDMKSLAAENSLARN